MATTATRTNKNKWFIWWIDKSVRRGCASAKKNYYSRAQRPTDRFHFDLKADMSWNRNYYYYYWLLNFSTLVGCGGDTEMELRTSVTIWRVFVSVSAFAFVSPWRTASWLFIIISCIVAVEPNRNGTNEKFESNLVWLWRWRWMDVSDAHWSLSRAQIKIKIVKFVAHRIILFLLLLLCLCLLLCSSAPASSALAAARLFSRWWMGTGSERRRDTAKSRTEITFMLLHSIH